MSLKINKMILEGDNAIQNTSPIILEKVFYNENVSINVCVVDFVLNVPKMKLMLADS